MRVRCDWARSAGMTPAAANATRAVYAADAYAVGAAVEESPQ